MQAERWQQVEAVPRGSRTASTSGLPICAKPPAATSNCNVRSNHCWLPTKRAEAWRRQPLILRQSGWKDSNLWSVRPWDISEILSHLGSGGMGDVYLAEDNRLHRKVALKLLPGQTPADAERLRRFEREALRGLGAESSKHCHDLRDRRDRRHAISSPQSSSKDRH